MDPTPFAFNKAGDAFSLHNPRLLERADFDLWNDSFCVTFDHTGDAAGNILTPNAQPYSDRKRPVYLVDLDTGDTWSASWGPVFKDPRIFSYDIHLGHVSWLQEYNGVASELSVSVPREANLEAWQLVLSNHRQEPLRLAVVPAFPTGLLGLLSQESRLTNSPFGILQEYFPYYVKIEDYEKMARRWNTTFFYPSREPDSWTAVERDFLGFHDWGDPEGLKQSSLNGKHCHYQRGLCACRYEIVLDPAARFDLGWIFGPARDPGHAEQVRKEYDPETAFNKAVSEQEQFRESQVKPLVIHSPDTAFDHYINHWSPDRSIRIGRTFRFNPSPQARNAIQDTMTLSLFDPATARDRFTAIWTHQDANGFMPHGLPMFPFAELMPITLIPHKDTNVWGPIALDVYLRETNDLDFLETAIPYTDGSSGSLAGHIESGLEWLLQERSPRGLSLIGQGDWNDPLNMAGPEGKGESIWLTEALACALDIWASILERINKDAGKWRNAADECRRNVRQFGWDGEWFLRAVSDDGTLIGSSTNPAGAIYLNAQSWAIMAGIPDDAQTQTLIKSVNKHLGTAIAPAVLGPAYPGMAKHVGKLTLKSPGTGENGSIYSHATLFWSYALYKCGHKAEAWRVLRNLVPGTSDNPIESAGQVPLYIPNFYRGPASPDIFGISSHSPNTGSAAWVYMTFVECVIGLKADGDRLLIQPNLPADWNHISGERLFRGTRYPFSMRRETGIDKIQVEVDGVPSGSAIEWVRSEKPVRLEVRLPVEAAS